MRGSRARSGAFFVGLFLLATLSAGCGSSGPHLPHVTVSLFGGPKDYQWNIKIASHGSGFGFSVLVIQYPDGRRHEWGGTLLQDGAAGTQTVNFYGGMPRGDYRYFVYGVPTSSKLSWYFVPVRAQVPKNLVASGSFHIQ